MRRSLGIFFGRVERAIYCDVIGGGSKKKSIVYFYIIYKTFTTLILVSNSKAKTKSRCSIFFPTTSLKAVVGCLPLLMLLSASSSRLFLHCNLIIFKSDYSEIFFISQMMMRLTKYNTTQQKNTLKDACVCIKGRTTSGIAELPKFEHFGTSLPNCLQTVCRPPLYYKEGEHLVIFC